MKRLFALILIIASCKPEKKNETDLLIEQTDQFIDSVKDARVVDSLVKATMKSAYLDTIGVSNAPVKVVATKIVNDEYSIYRDIRLTWKNISDKKISAIKFKWYGVDAFNEPANMGSGFDGLGAGMADRSLSPGKTDYGTWSTSSKSVKKILCAWPHEIAFADGTFWRLRN